MIRPVLLAALAVALAGCPQKPDGQVGSAAHDLVSGKAYPNLVVEIDYPSGYDPNPEAVSTLKATLQEVSGRDSAHVQIAQSASIPAEPSKQYRWSEIEALESQKRDRHTGGDTAVLYVIYVAGSSEGDTDQGKVLGAAYRGTSIVIFKGNVKANTVENPSPLSGKPEERFVERAVLVHEFGHAAGLVNLGTPMVRNHEDTAGGEGNDPVRHGHSINKNSVMHWRVENTGGLLPTLQCVLGTECGSDIPYQFDADDKADLKALRDG